MSINENRVPLLTALGIAYTVASRIRTASGMGDNLHLQICGSIARKRPDCGDIDLATTESDFPKIEKILMYSLEYESDPICDKLEFTKGTKKNPSKLHHGWKNGMKVEFYVGKNNAFGGICLFANGSGMFNVMMRAAAKKKGYKLSQYGLFFQDKLIACETEESIFEALCVPFLKPEQRERG
jgi:DNA polymerase (family 10)